MADYAPILHHLSQDDVLPAELVTKAVDTANSAATTFYTQHELGAGLDGHHTDLPFLVGRFAVTVPADGETTRIISSGGYFHSARWDTFRILGSSTSYPAIRFTVERNVRITGAHVMVRFSQTAVDVGLIRPTVVNYPNQYTGWVVFYVSGSSPSAAVDWVSVLIRGTVEG